MGFAFLLYHFCYLKERTEEFSFKNEMNQQRNNTFVEKHKGEQSAAMPHGKNRDKIDRNHSLRSKVIGGKWNIGYDVSHHDRFFVRDVFRQGFHRWRCLNLIVGRRSFGLFDFQPTNNPPVTDL